MTDIKVSCAGVFKLLMELDVHKAPGPDGLSPKLLKELAEELAPILTLLFQTSIQQDKMPDDELLMLSLSLSQERRAKLRIIVRYH